VGDQPGHLRPIKAGFAYGSMVLSFFFTLPEANFPSGFMTA